jgi:formylglycine-generating enzyme required for sulfatase activity
MRPLQTTVRTGRIILFVAVLLLVQSYRVESSAPARPHEGFTVPCARCHKPDGALPVSDYRARPECFECHLPDKDRPTASPTNETPYATVSLISNPAVPRKALKPSPARIIPEEMIFIPPGEFLMGNGGRPLAEGEGDPDETPAHHVYVPGFWMDRYEVTNAQYSKFVRATRYRLPKLWANGAYPPEKANHPVVYVDWYDANNYCHWAGKRLPSEAEWEKAARGKDGRHFPWGNLFDPKAANTPQYWLVKHQKGDTMTVGSFENGKSPYGLYDMAGNVYEWTADWYMPYPGNEVPNIHYGEKNRILRGGSWYDCLSYGCGLSSPVYNRSRFNPEVKNKSFGFRCAKSSEDREIRRVKQDE